MYGQSWHQLRITCRTLKLLPTTTSGPTLYLGACADDLRCALAHECTGVLHSQLCINT